MLDNIMYQQLKLKLPINSIAQCTQWIDTLNIYTGQQDGYLLSPFCILIEFILSNLRIN